ncbi:hypothetical protein HYV71_00030 [Candidatus Uhrbacteria bacterium]|nr:hypothetical protein [Candidatus Uhrbacteria bacterium]
MPNTPMPPRRTSDAHIRNIQKTRNTYYITLPVIEVRALGWRERQKVVVKPYGKGFLIRDWKPSRKAKI